MGDANTTITVRVSMKSGLEGRNNMPPSPEDIIRGVWSQ